MSKPDSVRGRVKALEGLMGILLQVVQQHDKYLYATIMQKLGGCDATDVKDAIIERQAPKEAEGKAK